MLRNFWGQYGQTWQVRIQEAAATCRICTHPPTLCHRPFLSTHTEDWVEPRAWWRLRAESAYPLRVLINGCPMLGESRRAERDHLRMTRQAEPAKAGGRAKELRKNSSRVIQAFPESTLLALQTRVHGNSGGWGDRVLKHKNLGSTLESWGYKQ